MSDRIEIDYTSVNSLPAFLALLQEKKVPENEYWRCVGAYQEKKAREKGIPLTGSFELTPLCNLDCKMCYVHLDASQLNGASLLSVDQWKNIMMQAHSMGMMNATLTGGECLTYPGFDELYLFLRDIGVKSNVKTNGVLLNNDRIQFFVKYPPRSIVISLYGSSNEAYRALTGHAVFETVYENLCLLKETNISVMLCITPSRYMYFDRKELLELANDLGFPFSINYALFPPRNSSGQDICDLSMEEYIELLRLQKKITSTEAVPIDECELPKYARSSPPKRGIVCGAGMSAFNVNWDGQMSGCDNLRGPYTSVLDKPFSDAWAIIHKAALNYLRPSECDECAYREVCIPCAALHNLNGEHGRCNTDICERTKRLVKEGIITMDK